MSADLPRGRINGANPPVPQREAIPQLEAGTTKPDPRRLEAASRVPVQRGQEADGLVLVPTASLAGQEHPRVLVLVTAKDPTPRRPRRSGGKPETSN
jgi:hypothetical protein